MTRRRATGYLCILLPSVLWSQQAAEILEAVTPLASALANGDADDFLRRIDIDAPNRDRLSDNVRGLIAQAEITSSVKLITLENGRAQLDWYMEIRSRQRQLVLERRKGPVSVRLRDRSIALIDPVDFFKPSEIR